MITRRQESTLFKSVIERLSQSEIAAMNDRNSPVLKSIDFRSLLGSSLINPQAIPKSDLPTDAAGKDEMLVLGRFFRLACVVSACQVHADKHTNSVDAVDRLMMFDYAWILLERLEFRKAHPEALLKISELLLSWCSSVQLLEQAQLILGFRYRINLCVGNLEEAKCSADQEEEIAILTKSTRQLELFFTKSIGRGVFACLCDPGFKADLSLWADSRFEFEIQSDYFDFLIQLVRFTFNKMQSVPQGDSGFGELVRIMLRPGMLRYLKRSPFRTSFPFAWPHGRDIEGLDALAFHHVWSACHPLWSFLAEWHVHMLLLNGRFDTALRWIPFLNHSGSGTFQTTYFHLTALLFSRRIRESKVLMQASRQCQPQNALEDFSMRIMEIRMHWNKAESDFLSARIEALRKYTERHRHEPGFRESYWLFVRLLSCLSRSWFDFVHVLDRHKRDFQDLRNLQALEGADLVFAYEPCSVFFEQKRFEESFETRLQ